MGGRWVPGRSLRWVSDGCVWRLCPCREVLGGRWMPTGWVRSPGGAPRPTSLPRLGARGGQGGDPDLRPASARQVADLICALGGAQGLRRGAGCVSRPPGGRWVLGRPLGGVLGRLLGPDWGAGWPLGGRKEARRQGEHRQGRWVAAGWPRSQIRGRWMVQRAVGGRWVAAGCAGVSGVSGRGSLLLRRGRKGGKGGEVGPGALGVWTSRPAGDRSVLT